MAIKFEAQFMLHGADYNYEQWLAYPEVIDRDFELMKLALCNVMSVGIFSWVMLEPAEGEYDFAWLDKLMDRLADNQIGAILATPSGARPAWMDEKYPEIRTVDENGRREPHRQRHNHCPTSPIYREKVKQINTLLAQRYASHPALFMWHVSNEYGNNNCRCDLCLTAFQQWLQRKYESLESLNHAWWTTFWSHRYTAWSQIKPVDPSIHGLMLDWTRFISDQVLDFYLAEKALLSEFTPDVPVTTNFMRPNVSLDYWAFAPHVDVIAWDSYPLWHSEADDSAQAAATAFYHDLHRTFKKQPFLLIESTPSVTNWQGISRPKRPGMHQLSSLQAVAHGADGVQYFQWRQSRGAAEKFHGAVVSHAGHAHTRTFQEVAATGKLLQQLQTAVSSLNTAETALIYDLQNEWALNMAQLPRSVGVNYQQRCQVHYRAFWRRGITVDILDSSAAGLSSYKLLIVPMLYMLRDGAAGRLTEFVRSGGTLVTTYLSGLVDNNDLVFMGGAPGPLTDLLGLWVEETDTLVDHSRQSVRWTAESAQAEALREHGGYPVFDYADVVHTQGAEVLAVFENDFYAGSAAVTRNRFGKGQAIYLAARHDDAFLADFYGWLAGMLNLAAAVDAELPQGVTVQARVSGGETFLFLMNFEPQAQDVTLGRDPFVDVLSGGVVSGLLQLDAYGYRVLRRTAADGNHIV